MSVTYIGQTNFADAGEPVASKNEYGIDVVTRRVMGAAPLLAAYLDSLAQGQSCIAPYSAFKLQTWSASDDRSYPVVSLIYKGLLGDNLPDPDGEDDVSLMSCTITTNTPQKASREIQFEASTTNWRYIANARPTAARVGIVANGRDPRIRSSVIRTEDGKEYFGNAPVGLVSALTPTIDNKLISLHARQVIGTPFFECEEVIARVFIGQGAT